jgi:RHS repeat-associated protein
VIDANSKEIRFAYLPNGKLHALIDFENRRTTYEYGQGSESDLLKRIAYPNGDATEFGYIGALLNNITPPSEIGLTLEYVDNKVSAIIDKAAVNRRTEIQYQQMQTVVTDSKTGATSTYVFADSQKEKLVGEAHMVNGNNRYITHGGDDKPETFEYVLEQEIFVNGVTFNDSLSITQLHNLSANAPYNELGPVWVFREIDERKVVREYASPHTADGLAQTASKIFVYDNNDQLIEETAIIQTTGRVDKTATTRYEYNKHGKIIRSVATSNIDVAGAVSETLYDNKGNVVRTQSYHKSNPSAKFIEEQEIAANGQIVAELDERGNKTVLKYEHDTNIVSGYIDPNGGESSVGRDPHTDEVLSVSSSSVDGEANTNAFEYDKGLLKSITSYNTKIDYCYDEFGRRTSTDINGGNHVSYDYNDNTNAIKAIYANGNGYETVADEFGKPLSLRYHQGAAWVTHITNEYDSKDRLERVTDHVTGDIKQFGYDKNGNIVSQTGKVSIATTYDIDGHIKKSTVGLKGKEYTYKYNYDDEGVLDSVKLPTPDSDTEIIEQDKLGRAVKLNTIAGVRELGYVQVGERATGLIATESHKDKQGSFSKLRYVYDRDGNITEVREAGRLRVRYAYDSLNRLVREDNFLLGKTETYEYDTNGNIASKNSCGFTLKSELFDGTLVTYAHDADKLMSLRTQSDSDDLVSYFQYDMLGNPTVYRGIDMQWDRVRNLASIDNGEVRFEYDASNLRIRKKTSTVHSKYYYSGEQLIAEKRSAKSSDLHVGDHLTPGYAYTQDKMITYLYGVDGITGFMVEQAGADAKVYSYRKNIMGDVLGIYDENGRVATYIYDAWGNHVVANHTADNIGDFNAIRYRGYYYDSETGFYYLKSRYYDPQLGRFISMDSVDAVEPNTINGLNLYAYCGNSPVMHVDPNGNSFWGWLKKNVVKVVLTVASVALVVAGVLVAVGTLGGGANLAGALIGAGIGSAIGTWTASDPLTGWAIGGLAGGLIGLTLGMAVGAMSAAGSGAGIGFGVSGGGYALAGIGGGIGVGVGIGQGVAVAVAVAIALAVWVPGTWPGDDPRKSPGDGFEWRGPGEKGSSRGEWYNPKTGDQLHPELSHPFPKGPHWSWRQFRRFIRDIFKIIK